LHFLLFYAILNKNIDTYTGHNCIIGIKIEHYHENGIPYNV